MLPANRGTSRHVTSLRYKAQAPSTLTRTFGINRKRAPATVCRCSTPPPSQLVKRPPRMAPTYLTAAKSVPILSAMRHILTPSLAPHRYHGCTRYTDTHPLLVDPLRSRIFDRLFTVHRHFQLIMIRSPSKIQLITTENPVWDTRKPRPALIFRPFQASRLPTCIDSM